MTTLPTAPTTMTHVHTDLSVTARRASARTAGERGHNASVKAWRQRIVYGAWRHLPHWLQRRIVRATVPSVTMGVCAVITDAQGRLLLGHHTYRQHPWGLPGGFTHGGEQPAETLARELREELGAATRVGPLLAAEMSPDGGHLTLYYRVAPLLGRPRRDGDGVEIDAWRYVALSDAEALLGTPRPSWLAHVHEALGASRAYAA